MMLPVRLISAFFLFLAASISTIAQEEIPFNPVFSDLTLPTNAVTRELIAAPAPFTLSSVEFSPAPLLSFQGLGDNGATFPPDTQGAVGPNHVVTMLNTQVRIQNRTGTTNISTTSLFNWWTNAGTFVEVFDPQIVYDALSARWIACVLTDLDRPDGRATNSSVLLAVSQTSDPTGAWHYQKIKADSYERLWADFPKLGFNKNWIVVSVNMIPFKPTNGFPQSRIYIFDKTNAYSGGATRTTVDVLTGGRTIVPMTTADPNVSTLYCLKAWNHAQDKGNGIFKGALRLHTITGSPSQPVFTAENIFPESPPWEIVVGANTQAGTSTNIDSGDDQLLNVVYRDGTLWTVHTVFYPYPYNGTSHAGIQWWKIPLNGLPESGSITNSSKQYGFPTIAVNRFNDVLIGYTSFASTQYASAEYVFRGSGESKFRIPYVLKSGVGPYVRVPSGAFESRWGDYSATMVDPSNDADFWTIQEYAEVPITTGDPRFRGRSGVWWGNVAVTVPGNNNFANAYQLSGYSGTTNGSLYRATREAAEPNHGGTGGTRSVWYTWTAPASGQVNFDTVQSLDSIDTLLAVYTGASLGALTLVASNDDYRGGVKSLVTFTATSGTTYRIAVDTRDTINNSITLHWNQPQSIPVILQDPAPAEVNLLAGEAFTLTSLASGSPTPTYQWRTNGVNISGATFSSYTNTNPQPATTNGPTTYQYDVVASNSAGSTASQIAYVTVYPSGTSTHTNWQYDLLNNFYSFHVFGVTTHVYSVQASMDFTNWVTLTNKAASFNFTNSVTTNFPYRFFRTVY
jgi:hypothetical protein